MLTQQITEYCNKTYNGSFRFLKDKMFIKQFGKAAYDTIQQHNSFLVDEYPISVKAYNYINNISAQPTCKMCASPVIFNSTKQWLTYCSKTCRGKDTAVTDKRRATNIEKYGNTNYLASEEGRKKSRETHMQRYGVIHYNQTEEYANRVRSGDIVRDTNRDVMARSFMTRMYNSLPDRMPLITPLFDLSEYLEHGAASFYRYKWQCNVCTHKFEWWLNGGKTPMCPKCAPKGTMHEEAIMDFLDKHGIEYVHNSRKLLGNGQEIDIFIPSKQLGIELNGLYYHQEHNVGPEYHADKTTLAAEQGIKLVQIFDDMMYQNRQAVFNFLRHELRLVKSVDVSSLTVKRVDADFARKFHNKYNALGEDHSNLHLGLYRNTRVVAVVSFKITKTQTELTRFTQNNTMAVTNGLSKIIDTLRTISPHNSIVCYADRCWSDGSELKALGFKHTKTTEPRYWYTKCFKQRLHRLQFQHKYLRLKLEKYDPVLTEAENMFNNDYVRVYDCGTLRYELTW
jgi:hypothetical protein